MSPGEMILAIIVVASFVLSFVAMRISWTATETFRRIQRQQGDRLDALARRVKSVESSMANLDVVLRESTPSPSSSLQERASASAPTTSAVAGAETEPEYVNFDCPTCGQNLEVPTIMAGDTINCPVCSSKIVVPATSTSPPVASPAQTGDDRLSSAEYEVGGNSKGTTMRIDLSKLVAEPTNKPKRQFVIRRRQ